MIVGASAREQSRARYPGEEGFVERDGVRVFYEVYGDAPTTFLLFPTSPISHSRLWKAQIPYLSRYFRVVVFDPRGNGRSDRPDNAEAYSYWEVMKDGRAVLEATGTETALPGGLCDGGGYALMLAATDPALALGVAAISPSVPRLTPGHPIALEGAGHIPTARHPVKINTLMRQFGEAVAPQDALQPLASRRHT